MSRQGAVLPQFFFANLVTLVRVRHRSPPFILYRSPCHTTLLVPRATDSIVSTSLWPLIASLLSPTFLQPFPFPFPFLWSSLLPFCNYSYPVRILRNLSARIHSAQSLLFPLSLSRTAWWSGPVPGARKECQVSFSHRLVSSLSPVLALCPVSGLLYFLKICNLSPYLSPVINSGPARH